MNLTVFSLILFVVTYICLVAFPDHRPLTAVISALIYVIIGVMPFDGILSAVNWNVLLMLAGTMGTVSLFVESRMPNRLADLLLNRCSNVMTAAIVMSLFAGVVSAFVDNVATVLMIAPVALAICRKLEISPVPMLIAISVSSNLQGAATLVGDTTSILLGGYAGMNFMNFFFMEGRFSIFWAVELGALMTVPVMMFLFRKDREPVDRVEPEKVEDLVPTWLLCGTVLLLILVSFFPDKPELSNGLICMGVCLIGVIRECVRKKSFAPVPSVLKEMDGFTLLLLAGLFVVVDSITRAGVIDEISSLFVKAGGGDLFKMYTLIVWGSVLISAFVDNIPYVAAMLPVVKGIAVLMGADPLVLYFGLLTGATLGGNLTPIGASANIATIGILKKNGFEVKTKDFLRIGIPFTLVAVLSGYLFIWLVWGMR